MAQDKGKPKKPIIVDTKRTKSTLEDKTPRETLDKKRNK